MEDRALQTRDEFISTLSAQCCRALRLSEAFATNTDSLANYDRESRRELGDVFALAAGIALLCRGNAVSRAYDRTEIQRYDNLFSIFSRYAFQCMIGSGAYTSLDDVRARCDGLATEVAEDFRFFEVDPVELMATASELANQ